MSIYSAHDYSILAVLGSLGIVSSLYCATSFGSYLTFELWEGAPPVHPSVGSNHVEVEVEVSLSDSAKGDESNDTLEKVSDIESGNRKMSERSERSENDGEECDLPSKKRARSGSIIEETVSRKRFIRILANFRPFPEFEGLSERTPVSKVDEGNEVVLAVYSMAEVRRKSEALNEALTSRNMYSPFVMIV